MSQIPRYAGGQVQIHFCTRRAAEDFQENKTPGDSGWRIACTPNMVELHATTHHPNYQRTDDPRAVTCQSCRGTDAYKKAMEGVK